MRLLVIELVVALLYLTPTDTEPKELAHLNTINEISDDDGDEDDDRRKQNQKGRGKAKAKGKAKAQGSRKRKG